VWLDRPTRKQPRSCAQGLGPLSGQKMWPCSLLAAPLSYDGARVPCLSLLCCASDSKLQILQHKHLRIVNNRSGYFSNEKVHRHFESQIFGDHIRARTEYFC
jgi:hypothetical protein